MNINMVRGVGFGYCPEYYQVRRNKDSFYSLPQNKKMDVVYDMLRDIRMEQDNTAETVTRNQKNIQCAAGDAFLLLSGGHSQGVVEQIYRHRTISTIPRENKPSESF